MLGVLRTAGPRGATGTALRLEKEEQGTANPASDPGDRPRRAALSSLIADGRVRVHDQGRSTRYVLQESLPAPADAAEKLLAQACRPTDGPPLLWRKRELANLLSTAERPLLASILASLEEKRELLRVPDGKRGERFLFAAVVRCWFGWPERVAAGSISPSGGQAGGLGADGGFAGLFSAYRQSVRESGGFPDVKISALRRALPTGEPAELSERLRALWREGRATLSLGDWSLASEEMRQAAVELDGERYLLVRIEDDPADADLLT